jgi:hypothetical protein
MKGHAKDRGNFDDENHFYTSILTTLLQYVFHFPQTCTQSDNKIINAAKTS